MDKSGDLVSKLSSYKGIILDLDGTIVDLGVNWSILKEKLKQYVKLKHDEEIIFSSIDRKLRYIKEKYGDGSYAELLNIISTFEENEDNWRVNKELLGCIENLNHEVRLGVYSMNTGRCVKKAINNLLKRTPDIVISKDNCIEPKPSAKDIELILKQWQLTPSEVIMVGNTEDDRLSGKLAGIKTVIISI